jgi:formate-dependent nitrite reductase membrane component NrfD
MNFFDCIYICGYRAYRDYDPRWLNYAPRGRATALLTFCIMSLSILFMLIVNKIHNLHAMAFIQENINAFMWVSIVGLFVLQYFIGKYYSQERIERLIEKFETKYLVERQIWGWVAGLTIVVPFILLGLKLTKPD